MSTQDMRIEGTAYDALTKLNSASAAAFAAGQCVIRRALAEFICYRAFRVAEAQLMALDDRMLEDIGLDRGEIRSALLIARHGAPHQSESARSRWPVGQRRCEGEAQGKTGRG